MLFRSLHNQIVLDVRQAQLRYAQARAELEVLDGQTRPEVTAAIQRAASAYRDGDVGYIVVLQTSRQLIDAELRQVQLHAELRRAWAELERSVGRHLEVPVPNAPPARLGRSWKRARLSCSRKCASRIEWRNIPASFPAANSNASQSRGR